MNTAAAEFFQKAKKWNEEFLLLRDIIRENPSLVEDYKWMHPCYTYEGKNVVLIHGGLILDVQRYLVFCCVPY